MSDAAFQETSIDTEIICTDALRGVASDAHSSTMVVVRGIGWALVLAGLIVLGRDLIAWRDAAPFATSSLYDLWFALGRASLLRLQTALAPFLWQMLRMALTLWAAPTLIVLGLALAWIR